MLRASVAGISPVDFWELTVGEILITLEAYNERERQSLINRISAILRSFSKRGDPYKGIIKPAEGGGSQAAAALLRKVSVKADPTAKPIDKATLAWIWSEEKDQ